MIETGFKRELAARIALLLILVGLPLLILGYQYIVRPTMNGTRVIDIVAAIPEAGGFQPNSIQASAGETITLRFTSPDVTHGIAIGPGLDVDLGHVDPGQVKEVTLTFDHAGTYTFYCNTWCSPNHWRMRGVVDVRNPAQPDTIPTAQVDPVIAALAAEGVNIDAAHTGDMAGHGAGAIHLTRRPSSARGNSMIATLTLPPELDDLTWRRSHTPQEAFILLRAHNASVSTPDLADAVAYLWTAQISAERLAKTAEYYPQNCAACHGETGGGDGFAAPLTAEDPIDFADPSYLFGVRADVLYAKIRRGGMGTDMPNFGTLITPEETWALVDYLWTLGFKGE